MKEESFYLEDLSKIYCEIIYSDKRLFEYPIIMIHGGGHTGACFKSTPDNRKGWAYYFVEQGFDVYIPDLPGCGRSGYNSQEIINGEFVVSGLLSLLNKINKKTIVLTHSSLAHMSGN